MNKFIVLPTLCILALFSFSLHVTAENPPSSKGTEEPQTKEALKKWVRGFINHQADTFIQFNWQGESALVRESAREMEKRMLWEIDAIPEKWQNPEGFKWYKQSLIEMFEFNPRQLAGTADMWHVEVLEDVAYIAEGLQHFDITVTELYQTADRLESFSIAARREIVKRLSKRDFVFTASPHYREYLVAEFARGTIQEYNIMPATVSLRLADSTTTESVKQQTQAVLGTFFLHHSLEARRLIALTQYQSSFRSIQSGPVHWEMYQNAAHVTDRQIINGYLDELWGSKEAVVIDSFLGIWWDLIERRLGRFDSSRALKKAKEYENWSLEELEEKRKKIYISQDVLGFEVP